MKIMAFIPWMDLTENSLKCSVAVVDTETGDTQFRTRDLFGYRYDYNLERVVRFSDGDVDQSFKVFYGIGPQDLITVFSDPRFLDETLYPNNIASQIPILREETYSPTTAMEFVGGHLGWVLKEEHIREVFGKDIEAHQLSQDQHPNASNQWEHFCFFCCLTYKKLKEKWHLEREEAPKKKSAALKKENQERAAAAAAEAERQAVIRKETLAKL